MSYIPELFAAQQAVRRLSAHLREMRAQRDQLILEKAFGDVLAAKDIDPIAVEAMLKGGNPRVDDEGKPLIDFGPDQSMTGTPAEANQFWRSNLEAYGNVVNIQPPPEPSPQQKRYAELAGMDMDEYQRERKQPDFFRPKPEPPAEQQ